MDASYPLHAGGASPGPAPETDDQDDGPLARMPDPRVARLRFPAERAPEQSVQCPCCGHAFALGDTAIKRGALQIVRDPCQVTWRGTLVPLSPTEAEVFGAIAIRGRATFDAIDAVIRSFGSNPGTRRMVMMRIRRKFEALGASDPFELVGNSSVRLRVEPDENDSTATIIGLKQTG
jgi:hypothetical protein